MSLVAVMLTDLMDRKFLPRLPAANQEEEDVKAVQEVEACLLRWVRVTDSSHCSALYRLHTEHRMGIL